MQSVSIIGIGRVGGALAIALSRAGFRVEDLVHRNPDAARVVTPYLPPTAKLIPFTDGSHNFGSDIVVIATGDPEVAAAADQLRGRLKDGATVLHTSGSLSASVLSVLADGGHPTAGMHPLISVSDPISGAESFAGAFFCIEGESNAEATARWVVESLGGRAFSIDSERKPLYHAAAVMACGHLVALIDIAVEMLSRCGVERDMAKEILLPLIASTVENLETRSPARALTGSFARLDVDAVKRHLEAIDPEMSDLIRQVYLLLGERSLELAASIGGNESDVQKMLEVISIAKRKSG